MLKRTIDVIIALSKKIPIISSEWLQYSLHYKKLYPIEDFKASGIIIDDFCHYFNCVNDISQLFATKAFFIEPEDNLFASAAQVKAVIINCGGIVLTGLIRGAYFVKMSKKPIDRKQCPRVIFWLDLLDRVALNKLIDWEE